MPKRQVVTRVQRYMRRLSRCVTVHGSETPLQWEGNPWRGGVFDTGNKSHIENTDADAIGIRDLAVSLSTLQQGRLFAPGRSPTRIAALCECSMKSREVGGDTYGKF